LACAITVHSAEVKTNSSDSVLAGIKTRFDREAVLSRDELLSVVALARDCGVSDVAEVYTYNIHPSSAYGIGVLSRETVSGRKISFVNVLMDYEKFSSKKVREMSRVFKANGEFWVNLGCVLPVSQTTFVVRGNTIRVEISDSTPLPIADKVVAALASGKIRYSTEKLKMEAEKERVDFSRPMGVSLDKDGKTFSASFSIGALAGMHLTFTFEEDVVTVTDVSVWVS
jgi:hypothetical protein